MFAVRHLKLIAKLNIANTTADIRDTDFCQQELQKLLPWHGKWHNFSAEYVGK